MNDDFMNYRILTIIFAFAISFALSFFMGFAVDCVYLKIDRAL